MNERKKIGRTWHVCMFSFVFQSQSFKIYDFGSEVKIQKDEW